jgi:anti-sigma factor ChrR (cupin superfamily)
MRISRITGSFVCLGAFVLATVVVSAQQKKEETSAHKIVHYGDLKWTPIMKGCDLAPVWGDPSAEEKPFVLRIRCAAGTMVPAHWHPTDEYLTVLKGTFRIAMGETFDEKRLETMNTGNFTLITKEMRHFGDCPNDCIVQAHGMGPFKVNWVNPAEVIPPDAAPSRKAKSKE